jgi:hypothetical protein
LMVEEADDISEVEYERFNHMSILEAKRSEPTAGSVYRVLVTAIVLGF